MFITTLQQFVYSPTDKTHFTIETLSSFLSSLLQTFHLNIHEQIDTLEIVSQHDFLHDKVIIDTLDVYGRFVTTPIELSFIDGYCSSDVSFQVDKIKCVGQYELGQKIGTFTTWLGDEIYWQETYDDYLS